MHRNPIATFVLLAIGLVLLFTMNLLWGSVPISLHETIDILFHGGEETALGTIHRNIILSSRLPQALTAVVAGAGLAVSGLQMQTVFHNPLAGPSVLGITIILKSKCSRPQNEAYIFKKRNVPRVSHFFQKNRPAMSVSLMRLKGIGI